jgi:mannan endo-1,4-beta-mannosidase
MRKNLIKLILTSTILQFSIFAVHSQKSYAQEFTVSGSKIKAPNGSNFIIKGTNIGLWADHSTANHVNYIKNVWKFNAVRLPLLLKPGDKNWSASDALIDRYIKAYTSNSNGLKTVIILDCHDHSGSFYTDTSSPSVKDLRQFWRKVASRYKNNPYVWFNIMNEPGSKNTVEKYWLDVHKLLIQDIRKQGAKNIIVVDGYNFASEDGNGTTKANFIDNSSSAFLTYGQQILKSDPLKRIVFSLHTYVNWKWNTDKLYDFVDRVHRQGLAMIVGEYAATTGSSFGDIDVTEAAKSVLEVGKKRLIGRLLWHYWSWDNNALTTASWGGSSGDSVNKTNGSRPTNLTWLGEKVWDDTHNLPEPKMGIPLNRFAWNASSTKGSAALAIDNVPDTQFNIGNPTTSDWLRIDLGSKQSFNQILMDSRKVNSSFLRSYKVFVSDSPKSQGKQVANIKNNAMANMRVSFPTQKARYITIVPQKFAKDKDISWAIAEFLVFRPGTAKTPVDGKIELNYNNWQASASKKSSWNAEWEDKAIDRNSKTRYASGGNVKNGDWFGVDMRSPQKFKTILLNAGSSENDYPRRFEVYVGNDPNKFGKPVFQGLGSPIIRVTFNSPISGRYIRVVNKQDYGDWWSIHDFRVYK